MSDDELQLDQGPSVENALPGLPGNRVIVPDAGDLIDSVAKSMALFAHRRVLEAGVFHLALSGGSTPQDLYRGLMIDPRYRLFPWRHTHLWIVDERCVGPDDDRLNYKMIRELLVEHCDLPRTSVHPMPVLEKEGDRRYESELRAALTDVEGRLDYVLLGMGSDAHTASLFPQSAALGESQRWVVFNDGPSVTEPRPRMTLTYPAINGARRIAVLVTGKSKHATLSRVAAAGGSGTPDPQSLPITGIRPTDPEAELTWYLDRSAALGGR